MLIVPAYAKLNLTLAVTRRREDGWHDIDSVVVPIEWHDLAGVAVTAQPGVRLRMTGEVGDIPAGIDNLAHRAGAALIRLAGDGRGVEIWLEKRLPALAGLGGGSADAAAVLIAGSKLWPGIGITDLATAAEELGSDVPALLSGRAVRARGRGASLQPVSIPPLWFVVALTGVGSTPAAYAELRAGEIADDGRVDRLLNSFSQGGLDAEACGSALEAAASRVNPALAANLARLRRETSVQWYLTGSGGAAFSIVPDAVAARALQEQVTRLGIPVRVSRSAH